MALPTSSLTFAWVCWRFDSARELADEVEVEVALRRLDGAVAE